MLPINITALDDPISLVHIPISSTELSVDTYSSRIYWTVERATEESQEFFNITSNRLEVAIFASKELVEDEWAAVAERDENVKLSEGWRVFEINSGDAGDDSSENYDSPHLRYVSAPLAKAGISILYQSSYHADFLMVKEADFELASKIFEAHGWTINPTSNPSPRHSLHTPTSSTPSTPSTSRPISSPTRHSSSTPLTPISATPPVTARLPSGPAVIALPSSLAFVGFHRSSSNFQLHTGIVQKYLTWPARCRSQYVATSRGGQISPPLGMDERPFISYTRTQDGASLATEVKVIRGMFRGLEEGMMCGEEMGEGWEVVVSETDLEVDGDSEVSHDGEDTETDEVSGSELDEDGDTSFGKLAKGNTFTRPETDYFNFPPLSLSPITPLLLTPLARRPKARRSPSGTRKRHRKTQSVPSTPGQFELESGFELSDSPPERRTHRRRATIGRGLSREKTARGLDRRSSGDEEEGEKRKKKGRKICIQLDMSDIAGIGGQNEDGGGVYHLDKSGLVTRFSTLLQQANIRMLYSSTFHTANILVEAKDVKLARRLLAGVT